MFTIRHCLLMVLAVFWGLDITNWSGVEARSTALWPKSNLIDEEKHCPRDIAEMDYNARQKYYNGLIRVKGKALLVDGECKSTESVTPAPTKTTDNCDTTSKKPSTTTKPTTENNCETASNTTPTTTECETTEKTPAPIVTLKIYVTQKSKEKDKNQDSSCKAKEMDDSNLKTGHTDNKIHKREIKTKPMKRAYRRHRQRHNRRDGKQKKARRHHGHSKHHRRQPHHHRQLHLDDNPSLLL